MLLSFDYFAFMYSNETHSVIDEFKFESELTSSKIKWNKLNLWWYQRDRFYLNIFKFIQFHILRLSNNYVQSISSFIKNKHKKGIYFDSIKDWKKIDGIII